MYIIYFFLLQICILYHVSYKYYIRHIIPDNLTSCNRTKKCVKQTRRINLKTNIYVTRAVNELNINDRGKANRSRTTDIIIGYVCLFTELK